MSLASHPAYFAAPQSPMERSRWRAQISKRTRYLTNRLSRVSPVLRRRVVLLVAVVVGVLILCAGSLTVQQPDAQAQRRALRRHASEMGPRVNVSVYPPFPDRPAVFPGADAAHLHGLIGRGQDGRPDWVPRSLSFKMTGEEKRQAHEKYCFNTRVSASLALDRKVPDFNSNRCRSENYDDQLPAADVVIVFHNEDLSVLLRSIHSILNRTPPALLHEIILVNDDSNRTSHPWLFEDLPAMLEHLPKTELIHLTSRRGLMMARMEGTYRSSAEVVVYLDSHIECTPRWLEPMLKEIRANPKRMVTPMIHSIDADNFEFESGAVGVVGFSWTLGQTHPHRDTDNYTPLASPVMAGGLFAANRAWFLELGGYDPEMKLYGGEEMEIGFKVWQCGGELFNLPCSRVGHVFRTDKFWKGQVYPVPMAEIVRNKLRTVEVWLDEYKPIAQLAMSKLPENYTLGPLDAVLAVRDKLQCKPFKWYLENVYPDLWVPDLAHFSTGTLTHPLTHACIDTMGRSHGEMGLYPCHGQHGSQALIHSNTTGEMRTAMSIFRNCLRRVKNALHMVDCSSPGDGIHFHTLPDEPQVEIEGQMTSKLLVKVDGLCLVGNKGFTLTFEKCLPNDPRHQWAWGG